MRPAALYSRLAWFRAIMPDLLPALERDEALIEVT
jgi:hypothetical protein